MSSRSSPLAVWDGAKTYLASSLLAGLGLLLLWLDDGKLGLALLAHGGGLAALRHAVARLQAALAVVERKLNPLEQRLP